MTRKLLLHFQFFFPLSIRKVGSYEKLDKKERKVFYDDKIERKFLFASHTHVKMIDDSNSLAYKNFRPSETINGE